MKRYYKFYKTIILLSIFAPLLKFDNIKGQTTSVEKMNLFKTSPETSKLFPKIDIPVNYSTGGINYSLPIYTIKLKNIEIPIQLNYRSSGFQINENATSVGLGWDLEIGGSITQTKKQGSGPENRINFDENRILDPRCNGDDSNPLVQARCSNSDYEWVMNSAFGGNQNYTLYASQLRTGNPIDGYVTRKSFLPTLTYDLKTEQDIFYYSFPGESGKFFYDSNKKKYFTIPYTRNEIELTSEYYRVNDSKGNKYYFSRTENTEWQDAFSLSTYYSNGTEHNEGIPRNPTVGVAKYFLKKIETSNGDIISFNYSPVTYRIEHPDIFNYVTAVNTDPRIGISSMDDFSQIDNIYRDSKTWGRTVIRTNRLDKIIVNGKEVVNLKYSAELGIPPGNVVAVPENQKPRSIEEITINEGSRKIICNLNYDYFGKTGVNNPNDNVITSKKYRLRLNSVAFNDGALYNFNYYEDNNITLPDKNAADKKDHLGYFNNQSHFYTTYKTKDEVYEMATAPYKSSNLEASQLTVLKSIEYPTKGKDEFIYALGTRGGLNIESIKTYENINNTIPSSYKKFRYYDSHSIEPRYSNTVFANVFKGEYEGIPLSLRDAVRSYSFTSYSSSAINQLIAFNGFPNFYETVEEYSYDKDNNNKGMTKYRFTYERDPEYSSYGPHHFTIPLTDNSWKRGLLKSTTTFKAGDFTTPIRSIMNTYKFGDLNLDYSNLTLGSALPSVNKNQGYFVNYFISLINPEVKFQNHTPDISFITPYQPEAKFTTHINLLVSGSVYKTAETVIEWLDDKSLTTNTNYSYDETGSNQLKSQKITFPDGNVSETTYTYAEEEGKTDMINANMVGIPLRTETKFNNKLVSKTFTDYLKNTQTNNLILPTLSQVFDLQNPAVAKNEITYDHYDNKGNITQFTEKGSNTTTVIWGYNQTLPIARIDGASYDQVSAYIAPIIFASDIDQAEGSKISEQTLINALDAFRNRTEFSEYKITTYTYDPLAGVSSITPPSGIRENYKYNNITNRLELVSDVNNKILKEYQYHYPDTYYSSEKNKVFTKNNCPDRFIPGTYNYVVPVGKYYSIISQADADQKAENDINQNGQNITNQNASCTGYFNAQLDKMFTRNNCQSNETGGTYIYIVPNGKYFSTISQEDANQKAQNAADMYASCIAGECEINSENAYDVVSISSRFAETTPGRFRGTIGARFSDSVNQFSTVVLGYIGSSCSPTTNEKQVLASSNGNTWRVYIHPNGEVSVRFISGTFSKQVSLSFEYDKN